MGRKSQWDIWVKDGQIDNILTVVKDMAFRGHTHKEIGKAIKISHNLFAKLLREQDEFSDAIKTYDAIYNAKVGQSLYKECIGYHYTEQMAFKTSNVHWEEGKKIIKEEIELVDVQKWARPNNLLIIFFMTNRLAQEWKRDRKDATNAPVEDFNGLLEAVGLVV